MSEFIPFPKIPRLSREVIVTEKIDGTNASILIALRVTGEGPTGQQPVAQIGTEIGPIDLWAGSRSRWITPRDDNYGFARWAADNALELAKLGPGHHFGEWWGQGIQRNYSQTRKRFSLFNTHRWGVERPACCDVVPVLYRGPMEEHGVMKGVKASLSQLHDEGSVAAPGFMNPEGIVIFHPQGNILFKKTLEKDEDPKGMVRTARNPQDLIPIPSVTWGKF